MRTLQTGGFIFLSPRTLKSNYGDILAVSGERNVQRFLQALAEIFMNMICAYNTYFIYHIRAEVVVYSSCTLSAKYTYICIVL